MIKRPYYGFINPKLRYPVLKNDGREHIKEVPLPSKVILCFQEPITPGNDQMIKAGDKIKTGQKLKLNGKSKGYLISSVTGTVSSINQQTGYMEQISTAVSIDVGEEDQWVEETKTDDKTATLENAREFLGCLPGHPNLLSLFNDQLPLDTFVINGLDKDLLITTNQLIVRSDIDRLTEGIEYLKKIIGAKRIVIIVPPDLAPLAGKTGAEVKTIRPLYPNALPEMVMKNVLDKVVPAGKSCEDMGVGFINAETVVAIANAFSDGEVPVEKLLTVIRTDGSTIHVKVRIGTPVKNVLESLNIGTGHGDRLIIGGPMSGRAIYSEDVPVLHDTDAIMIQDKDQIIQNTDSQCLNCGECIRSCPANIPVNMLVRLLENSLYKEAVEEYDLLSCIECGLCSYVCTARIPVFHYIMVGKHESAMTANVEAANA